LTAILLVASTDDLATDLIAMELNRRGAAFARVDPDQFVAEAEVAWSPDASASAITLGGRHVSCAQVKSVWFRHGGGPTLMQKGSPSAKDFASQEWAGFLAGFWETGPSFWINRPSALRLANLKLRQLEVAAEGGLKIPRTLVTNCAVKAREFAKGRSCVAKSILSAGYTEAEKRYSIFTTPIRGEQIDDAALRASPVILQERVPNGYDLRVTIIGGRIFATRIVVTAPDDVVDWRTVEPCFVRYEVARLSPGLAEKCLDCVRRHSLVYAALDFIVTPDGDPVFLELNPSGQWGWLEEATDAPITDTIVDCLVQGAA
jgi:glutathione synthase/RimK-type ligase-like ATP-grasp enzyme